MQIESFVSTMIVTGEGWNLPILKGVGNYRIDLKKSLVVGQLRALRDSGMVKFDERLPGDPDVQGPTKATKRPTRDTDTDIRERKISDESSDKGPGRSEVSKRRDGTRDKASKVRRKSSKKS